MAVGMTDECVVLPLESRGRARASRGGRPGHGRGRGCRVLNAINLFKLAYAEDTWRQDSSTYGDGNSNFSGPTPGVTFPCRILPSLLSLFQRFWSPLLLRAICDETNAYASQLDSGQKKRYWSRAKRVASDAAAVLVQPQTAHTSPTSEPSILVHPGHRAVDTGGHDDCPGLGSPEHRCPDSLPTEEHVLGSQESTGTSAAQPPQSTAALDMSLTRGGKN
jgi:hypothetical protein